MKRKVLIYVLILLQGILLAEEKYEYSSTFGETNVDLTNKELLPTETMIGNTYQMKGDEEKVTYTFKKDSTYSFKMEVSIFKMITYGEYEINGNELVLYPKAPEGRVFGIKIKNQNIEASFYDPEYFNCFVYKDGILLDNDFFKKK